MDKKDINKQSLLRDFVEKQVYVCQSMLVEWLLKEEKFNYEDIVNVYKPLAVQVGYDTPSGKKILCTNCNEKIPEGDEMTKDGVCDNCNQEQPQEIFEWWVVSDWLLNRLEKKGEPVLKTDYGDWWGRTCTGQAIFLDGGIEEIYDEMMK